MTSPSTLSRRAAEAEKKGHKSVAKRLREKAAAMRRKARKSNPPLRGRTINPAPAGRVQDALRPLSQMQAGLSEIQPEAMASQPTLTDIANNLLAEKGKPGFEIKLRAALVDARINGEKVSGDEVARLERLNAVSVVAGWMSIIELARQANGGSLPPTVSMAGFTAAKVYDALKEAGYSTRGNRKIDILHWRRPL